MIVTMCMENADPSHCKNTNEYCTRKCTVIGEVTPNFELAKTSRFVRSYVRYKLTLGSHDRNYVHGKCRP